jgi:hypothetical protein
MDKMIRCSLCTWRGTTAEAASVRVQPAPLPPALEEVQRVYGEKQAEEAALGGHQLPRCPVCGNHTLVVKLHRSHAAI